jgi:hypothetical protein
MMIKSNPLIPFLLNNCNRNEMMNTSQDFDKTNKRSAIDFDCSSRKRRRCSHKVSFATTPPTVIPSPPGHFFDESLWIKRDELVRRARSLLQDVVVYLMDDAAAISFYSDRLIEVYTSCCTDAENSQASSPTCMTLDIKAFLGAGGGDYRGLESQILPLLSKDRKERRRTQTRSLVKLHVGLVGAGASQDVIEAIVGALSCELSQYARNYASFLGAADAAEAFSEYACEDMEAIDSTPGVEETISPSMVSPVTSSGSLRNV